MAFHCPDKYGAIDGIRTRDPQLGKLRELLSMFLIRSILQAQSFHVHAFALNLS